MAVKTSSSMSLVRMIVLLGIASTIGLAVAGDEDPVPATGTDVLTTDPADLEVTPAATATGGGIGNFPGMKAMTEFLAAEGTGGFGEQMAALAPCDPSLEGIISDECKAEMKDIPKMFSKLFSLNFEGVDLNPFCAVCNPDDVITYLEKVRELYKEEDQTDITCGNILAVPVAGDPFFDLTKVFLASACAADAEDRNCWTDVLPETLPGLGLTETMGAVDFNNLSPATLTGLLANVDPVATCAALEGGGCCSGMMLDIMGAMTDLTCLNTPLISSAFSATSAMCPNVEDACDSYTMPDFTPIEDCPQFSEWVETLNTLVLPSETDYTGCTVTGCPKNDCQMFMCLPEPV